MKSLFILVTTFTITYFFYNLNKEKLNPINKPSEFESGNLPKAVGPNPDDTFKNRAKLHSLFHSSIFQLLNDMIVYKTQSEEVKESYLAVVKANMGLMNIGRGYEHNFFNGTLSKNIATTFLEDLVNLYTKFIIEEDPAFTNDDLEIFKYMVDNHTIMMKDYQRIQKGNENDGFKKYKILFTKEKRIIEDFEYSIVRVDGLEVLEDGNNEKKLENSNTNSNNTYSELYKEIRETDPSSRQ
mgnify:CR=1 FL=1